MGSSKGGCVTLMGETLDTNENGYVSLNCIFTKYGSSPEGVLRWLQNPLTRILMVEITKRARLVTILTTDSGGNIYVHPLLSVAAIIHCWPPTKYADWIVNISVKPSSILAPAHTQSQGTQTITPNVTHTQSQGTQTLPSTETVVDCHYCARNLDYIQAIGDILLDIKMDLKASRD